VVRRAEDGIARASKHTQVVTARLAQKAISTPSGTDRREAAVVGYAAVVFGLLLVGGLGGLFARRVKRSAADLGPVSAKWLKRNAYRDGQRGDEA
jgi:hypothetical protein